MGCRTRSSLRGLADCVLPASESPTRPKQPYRAPGVEPFFGPGAPGVGRRELLGDPALSEVGIWDPAKVAGTAAPLPGGHASAARARR